MRFAVLDDTNYPTSSSKYWQCIREQDVFFTQLILTSCEYQILQGELELLEIEYDEEHQHKQRIEPVHRSLQIIDAKIIDLELKSTLPYLRNELLSSISDYDQLEKTDPQYRQKQSDMKKSIYKQSQKVDELETKFNWFGNIPTNEPKIITPEPILQTTVHYEVNKRPLLILGALGLIGLFVIWRFKQ